MRLKPNYALRQVADSWVVLPLAEATMDLNGMLTLNDSGALLWRTLEEGATREGLVQALLDAYDVEPQVAAADVDEFVNALRSIGCVE